jgi:hypothetical protein
MTRSSAEAPAPVTKPAAAMAAAPELAATSAQSQSEGGMVRLKALIDLELIKSSFASLSSY